MLNPAPHTLSPLSPRRGPAAPRPDTIFALSSGRGPAAIAIIRISGPRAGDALKALGVKIPVPRKAGLARVRNPDPLTDNEIIDEALALWFPAPHSETGEDVTQLQLHGGRAVIAAVLAALAAVEGLRMAEAGEFTRRAVENGKLNRTAGRGPPAPVEGRWLSEAGACARRAFENGKLDLTEVEGLADLVMAETQG